MPPKKGKKKSKGEAKAVEKKEGEEEEKIVREPDDLTTHSIGSSKKSPIVWLD